MTQKAGQKCTAIRRVLVPAAVADRVRDDLVDRLAAIVVGNPAAGGVRMGPLATAAQLDDVREGIAALAARRPARASATAEVEAGRRARRQGLLRRAGARSRSSRGPTRPTVHAQRGLRPRGHARALRRRSADGGRRDRGARPGRPRVVGLLRRRGLRRPRSSLGLAPFHGRVFLGSAKIAEQSPGPGTVLPQLVHGGPGRAGGGEELGGLRGLAFYLQRVALEGSRPVIEKIVG